MKQYIADRTLAEADYTLKNKSTVRQTAAALGVSKSTAHKDLSVRLAQLDRQVYTKVCAVLAENLEERYMRGGLATKQKYLGGGTMQQKPSKN